ncbi:cell division protein ZapD [Permianibacter sp. IMCC34836]|uniref:cell division protein ZapD n=1 Tax=Permianibacter fluminis TaxID=2738515 RepID=UPI001553E474|nr:cell division protein ZapD [Permianibacter fluminis]NQD37026.1 cell division protein ZapD [Permianibacter fluminis]
MTAPNLLLFEQPLNEKTRVYLRLEGIFNRAQQLLAEQSLAAHYAAFGTLFELMDSVDHGDLRGDLHSDLDRQLQQLRALGSNPQVDADKLGRFLQQLEKLHHWIVHHQGKFAARLRENEFLHAIKHRYTLPGGTCAFDLPRLYCFLQRPADARRERLQQWLNELHGVRTSVDVLLRLMRENTNWRSAQFDDGFFQLEPVHGQLLRLRMPSTQSVYPEVSSGRQRCVIRLAIADDEGAVKYLRESSSFEYSLCG